MQNSTGIPLTTITTKRSNTTNSISIKHTGGNEKKLATTQKECLVVVWAVLLFRSYLKGNRFTVRTDHEAIMWLLSTTEATDNPAHWLRRLLKFVFDVVHHASVKQQAANALSCLKTDEDNNKTLEDEIPTMTIFHEDNENQSLKHDADTERLDRQRKVTKKAVCYVSAVLTFTEVNNKNPPILEQLL